MIKLQQLVVLLLAIFGGAVLQTVQAGEGNSTCFLEPETGSCKAKIERWFFNSTSNQCETFTYGGCGGNENNFESEEDCNSRCICSLPAVVGPCRGAFTRWFYNPKTGCCERFSFGGCGGNANNFFTPEDCQKTCPQRQPQKCG